MAFGMSAHPSAEQVAEALAGIAMDGCGPSPGRGEDARKEVLKGFQDRMASEREADRRLETSLREEEAAERARAQVRAAERLAMAAREAARRHAEQLFQEALQAERDEEELLTREKEHAERLAAERAEIERLEIERREEARRAEEKWRRERDEALRREAERSERAEKLRREREREREEWLRREREREEEERQIMARIKAEKEDDERRERQRRDEEAAEAARLERAEQELRDKRERFDEADVRHNEWSRRQWSRVSSRKEAVRQASVPGARGFLPLTVPTDAISPGLMESQSQARRSDNEWSYSPPAGTGTAGEFTDEVTETRETRRRVTRSVGVAPVSHPPQALEGIGMSTDGFRGRSSFASSMHRDTVDVDAAAASPPRAQPPQEPSQSVPIRRVPVGVGTGASPAGPAISISAEVSGDGPLDESSHSYSYRSHRVVSRSPARGPTVSPGRTLSPARPTDLGPVEHRSPNTPPLPSAAGGGAVPVAATSGKPWEPFCQGCGTSYDAPPRKWNCPRCLPTTKRKVWQPESMAMSAYCALCCTKLTPLTRFHCRSCGRLCCSTGCCYDTITLPHLGYTKPAWVCEPCYRAASPRTHTV